MILEVKYRRIADKSHVVTTGYKKAYILLRPLEVPAFNSRNSRPLCVLILLNCDVGAMSP